MFQVWNAMIDRRPALFARCASPEDVVEAVTFAREHVLLVSIRGGGHNIAGSAVCDDGLMVDLSPMNSVQVDPKVRRATVEAGRTLADLDAATQAHGLAALALCVAGDPAEGGTRIEPLLAFDAEHGEHIGVQPYTAWRQALGPLLTRGARDFRRSHHLSQLSDGVIDAVIEYAGTRPSPQCEVPVGTIGGQTTCVPPDAMAYSSRDALCAMNAHGRWESAAEDERCIARALECRAGSQPLASGGAYINFLTQEEADRIALAYGATRDRVVRVKKAYASATCFA